jgi:hypothetical protein
VKTEDKCVGETLKEKLKPHRQTGEWRRLKLIGLDSQSGRAQSRFPAGPFGSG